MPFRDAPPSVPPASHEKHSELPASISAATDRASLLDIAGGCDRRTGLIVREHDCFRFLPVFHHIAVASNYDSLVRVELVPLAAGVHLVVRNRNQT